MHHFDYRDGQLFCEDVPLADISRHIGTPTYVYATATLTRHYRVLAEAMAGIDVLIAYALKANANIGVLACLARLGAGADIVSGGELARALRAGIAAEKIVFSGVGKSRHEIDQALRAGIGMFNVESRPELHRIDEAAQAMGKRAPIALRVNPRITAGAHEHIRTGREDDKFGIDWDDVHPLYELAAGMKGISVIGIDMHIGSQITHIGPLREAFTRLSDLIGDLRRNGHQINRIDLGGGLAIPYMPGQGPDGPALYGKTIRETLDVGDAQIIVEPGRMIVGNAGILLARTEYVKNGKDRVFVVLDAGMNDLIRPALYGGHHEILPLREPESDSPMIEADVVGPVCESADCFGRGRTMPPLAEGDEVAIMSAGAYGASMSSQYNGRALIPEVMVSGDRFSCVRKRMPSEEAMKLEHIPDWLDHDAHS